MGWWTIVLQVRVSFDMNCVPTTKTPSSVMSVLRYVPAVFAWLWDESINMFSGSFNVGVGDSISFLGIPYAVSVAEEIPVVRAAFQHDYESRIFLPYRRGFSPLVNTEGVPVAPAITSDSGWGCIIRSMQMAVAQSLISLTLGRDFRKSTASTQDMEIYREIAYLFADRPDVPLSIHRFSVFGQESFGLTPKTWFAPMSASLASSDLWRAAFGKPPASLNDHEPLSNPTKWDPYSIGIVSVMDGMDSVYEEIVTSLKTNQRGTIVLWNNSLFRFPTETIRDSIIKLFSTSKLFQGIVGGALWRGYYFVGANEHKLYFMDPHETRDAILNMDQLGNVETITSHALNRLRWSRLASSVSFVFAIKNLEELENLKKLLGSVPIFEPVELVASEVGQRVETSHEVFVNQIERTPISGDLILSNPIDTSTHPAQSINDAQFTPQSSGGSTIIDQNTHVHGDNDQVDQKDFVL
jgi:hypothetical protein